jgi:hypothetical protein
MGSIPDSLPSPKHLDPHEAPPQELKDIYKSWTSATALTAERLKHEVLDTESLEANACTKEIPPEILGKHFGEFLANNGFQTDVDGGFGSGNTSEQVTLSGGLDTVALKAAAYDIKKIPGKKLISYNRHRIIWSMCHNTSHGWGLSFGISEYNFQIICTYERYKDLSFPVQAFEISFSLRSGTMYRLVMQVLQYKIVVLF